MQQQQQQQQQISTPVATTASSLPESEKRKTSANNAEHTKVLTCCLLFKAYFLDWHEIPTSQERQTHNNGAGKEKEDVIELQEYPITMGHEKKTDETDKTICEEANKPHPFTAENEGNWQMQLRACNCLWS